jgi:hypothetical protein
MSREREVPQGFTLGMALMDAVPVVCFAVGSAVLSARLQAGFLFVLGAVLCTAAGTMKVLWKVLIACRSRNVIWLSIQLRVLMPAGFLLMAGSLLLAGKLSALLAGMLKMPSLAWFLAGAAGLAVMMRLACTESGEDARANWKEQAVNCLAQGAILIGVLLMHAGA